MESLERSFKILEKNFSDHPMIVSKIKEYVELIYISDVLTKEEDDLMINSAYLGITLCRSSMIFRIINNKKKNLVINFVNFRNWERILPIGSKNHFRIRGTCYDHSFSFRNETELCDFFDKYILSSKGMSSVFIK